VLPAGTGKSGKIGSIALLIGAGVVASGVVITTAAGSWVVIVVVASGVVIAVVVPAGTVVEVVSVVVVGVNGLVVVVVVVGGVLGVVTVRLERSNSENDPPDNNVMTMPAITATRATPMRRSGQFRLIQSIIIL
jgi:hypothetical protein